MTSVKSDDTVAAIATGAGKAGIGVVRVSGPLARSIATDITARTLDTRHAHYLPFLNADGTTIDVGIALLFDSPNSYTGEDVLELQGHGGTVVLGMLLSRVVDCGARLAKPGEFTERAFLNNKLDLAQAEAVSDLIESSSISAAQAAVRSMSGEFSARVHAIQKDITALRAWLEAALDFSEEEIDFLSDPTLKERAERIVDDFKATLLRAHQGQRLRDGLTLVIAGITNVGKSSLLNALSGEQSAIVTDIAGTTRDILREQITIEGIPLHVVDTAGLRNTDDKVEMEGIRRAKMAMASADHVLVVVDAERMQLPDVELPAQVPVTLVVNKADLAPAGNGMPEEAAIAVMLEHAAIISPQFKSVEVQNVFSLSVKSGAGLDNLRQHLLDLVGHNANLEGTFIARQRHLDALALAETACVAALEKLRLGDMPELAAEEFRQAQLALDNVTGRFDSEDLLGEIFGAFCIGK